MELSGSSSNRYSVPFPIDYNNLDDQQIVEILKIDKIKMSIDKTFFLIVCGFIFFVSSLVFIYEKKIFNVFFYSYFLYKFSFFSGCLTTYFSYKYLAKKHDMNDLIDSLFPDRYKGKNVSYTEKKIQFFATFFLFNIVINFFNIYAINDLSSIFLPSEKFDVFISEKSSTKVKSKYNYYIKVSNWKDNGEQYVKLQVKEEDKWNELKEKSQAQIKIKRGILTDVIWSLKNK